MDPQKVPHVPLNQGSPPMGIVEGQCRAGWTTGLTQTVICYVLVMFLFFMTKEDMPHANDCLYLIAVKLCASVFPFLGRSNTHCLDFLPGWGYYKQGALITFGDRPHKCIIFS